MVSSFTPTCRAVSCGMANQSKKRKPSANCCRTCGDKHLSSDRDVMSSWTCSDPSMMARKAFWRTSTCRPSGSGCTELSHWWEMKLTNMPGYHWCSRPFSCNTLWGSGGPVILKKSDTLTWSGGFCNRTTICQGSAVGLLYETPTKLERNKPALIILYIHVPTSWSLL